MKVKFFGALTDVHGVVSFKHLGQEADLPEALVKDVVNGGGLVLPSDQYESVGISKDEERKHPYPGDAMRATDEFRGKRKKLASLFVAFKEGLNTPPAEAVVEPAAHEVQ